jgi:hypothetical protein
VEGQGEGEGQRASEIRPDQDKHLRTNARPLPIVAGHCGRCWFFVMKTARYDVKFLLAISDKNSVNFANNLWKEHCLNFELKGLTQYVQSEFLGERSASTLVNS